MTQLIRHIFIGDIQGCAGAFERLLKRVKFDPDADRLCLAGDLVNRGGRSHRVLKRMLEFGERHLCVLGNHDLHLLAYAHAQPENRSRNREFEKILDSALGERMLDWLRRQPLLWTWPERRIALVHAGIDPRWNVARAMACARELEQVLAGPDLPRFLNRMYGDRPTRWKPDLSRWKRLRTITNVFTRTRFVSPQGHLDFSSKGHLDRPPPGFRPWFDLLHPDWQDWTILFGHWSLLGLYQTPRVVCLDSGCVWGQALSALVVEGEQRDIVQVDCSSCAR